MKKLFTLIAILLSVSVRAQHFIGFDGTDTLFNQYIVIDTVNYHHNQWQVGAPHKTTFTSALSTPNVLITDTLNPYSPNDTSVFILKMAKKIPGLPGSGIYGPLYSIQFRYQLDMDSLSSARLEISEDSGAHWHDVNDSLIAPYSWVTTTDTIALSTGSWKSFNVIRNFGPLENDTALFRFTFISGNGTAPHDGWMIDNIDFYYYFEGGITQIQNENLISFYPNPSKGNIYIHATRPAANALITLYDLSGRQVYMQTVTSSSAYFHLPLASGMYMLKYAAGNEYCIKKIAIDN